MKSTFDFMYLGYGIPDRTSWGRQLYSSFNRFHVPLKSNAEVSIGDEKYLLEVGKMYILPSHISFCIGGCDVDQYEHVYSDFYVLPVISERKVIVLDPEKDEYIKGFMKILSDCVMQVNEGRHFQLYTVDWYPWLKSFMKTMLLYALDTYKIGRMDDNRLLAALSFIYNNFSENIGNKDIANSIYVHPRHLTRIFKEALNVSPHQFLLEYRINHAKEMLDDGMSVKEVAERCGFEDVDSFRKAFKKINGISPQNFSKK